MIIEGPDVKYDYGYNVRSPVVFKWRGVGAYRFELLLNNKTFATIAFTILAEQPSAPRT